MKFLRNKFDYSPIQTVALEGGMGDSGFGEIIPLKKVVVNNTKYHCKIRIFSPFLLGAPRELFSYHTMEFFGRELRP